MPTVLHTPLTPADTARVHAALARARLVVVPTDTVYGIGAAVDNEAAVRDLVQAKGRDLAMPPPVLIASTSQRDEVVASWPPAAQALAERWWPGALTLVVTARARALGWDPAPVGGTVAVRHPDHPDLCALLRSTGPLAVTSANLHGQEPATDAVAAEAAFGERADLYIDAGPTPGPTPSTIVAIDDDGSWRILREGIITAAAIAETCAGV